MKKTYSKPALYAESFELAEHIALCSGFDRGITSVTHWGDAKDTTCTFTTNGFVLFSGSNGGCVYKYDGNPGDFGIECYNSPSGSAGSPFGS